MTAFLVLESDHLRAHVAPQLGASVLRLDHVAGGLQQPVLRATEPAPEGANVRAMFLMIPWANRVSGEGLPFEGTVYPLPRLIAEQAMPCHGLAIHQAYRVREHTPERLALTLRDGSTPPFDYEVEVVYTLDGPSFVTAVSVRHLGEAPAPYGFGFHPFLVRGNDDLLSFAAKTYAEEDAARLPTGELTPMAGSQQDFGAPAPLPDGHINNTYLGWDGTARLDRRDGLAVTLAADGAAGSLVHVYSRGTDCGFVCLEPMTHTVDCANNPIPGAPCLARLAHGETLAASMTISVDTAAPARR